MARTTAPAKRSAKLALAVLSLAFATAAEIPLAYAEPGSSTLPVRKERVESTGPNRQLLRMGTWTLGLSYAPALVVAVKSERRGDDYLYYPVVGPWLDLSHRGECLTCRHEKMNEALLVADGIFQGVGALQLVGSFLLPERRTVETVTPPVPRTKAAEQASVKLRVRPVRLSSGYGLQATAKF
jgi:hypothetical protein